MPVQSYKETYDDILSLYDYAEALVDTVEDARVTDAAAQKSRVEELVESLETSTEVLSGQFFEIAQADGAPKSFKKSRVETAFRKIFSSIDNYKTKAVELGKNIADEIVLCLEQHLEHIVAMFLEFIDLSVTRFMHHLQIEEMKKRERHVAGILHGMGLNYS